MYVEGIKFEGSRLTLISEHQSQCKQHDTNPHAQIDISCILGLIHSLLTTVQPHISPVIYHVLSATADLLSQDS